MGLSESPWRRYRIWPVIILLVLPPQRRPEAVPERTAAGDSVGLLRVNILVRD